MIDIQKSIEFLLRKEYAQAIELARHIKPDIQATHTFDVWLEKMGLAKQEETGQKNVKDQVDTLVEQLKEIALGGLGSTYSGRIRRDLSN